MNKRDLYKKLGDIQRDIQSIKDELFPEGPPNKESQQEQLAASKGWGFLNTANCKGCSATIDWYKTDKSKYMPLNAGTDVPHWSTCPNREQFKRKH
jgi:hypothetical protein